MKKRREAAVDEKSVEVAVLVVVDPRDAGAHGFEIKALRRRGALVAEANAGFARDVAKLDVERIRVIRLRVRRILRCGRGDRKRACEQIGGSDQKNGGESESQ